MLLKPGDRPARLQPDCGGPSGGFRPAQSPAAVRYVLPAL